MCIYSVCIVTLTIRLIRPENNRDFSIKILLERNI